MYPYWQSQGAAKAMFSQATAVKSVWIVLVIFFFQITKHKAVYIEIELGQPRHMLETDLN